MKKIVLLIFLAILFFSLIPVQAEAGVVPCGLKEDDPKQNGDQTVPCQFCHFFVLFNNIVKFFLFKIVPPLAALMIVIAGFYFFTAGQNPAMLSKARDILTATLWGLIIIFGAWVFINLFFSLIGINKFNEFKTLPQNWFQIKNCPLTP